MVTESFKLYLRFNFNLIQDLSSMQVYIHHPKDVLGLSKDNWLLPVYYSTVKVNTYNVVKLEKQLQVKKTFENKVKKGFLWGVEKQVLDFWYPIADNAFPGHINFVQIKFRKCFDIIYLKLGNL